MQTDPFKEYLKQQEPDKKYKGYAWQTAIGLQAVDGLKPSEYLVDAAIQNIEGKITLDEVKNLLDSYYEEKPQKNHDRTEEADKVSIRIAKILSEHAFSFTPNEYISIHRKLFTGIYDHAGKIFLCQVGTKKILRIYKPFIGGQPPVNGLRFSMLFCRSLCDVSYTPLQTPPSSE